MNPGCCCHVVCSRPLQTHAKKPQVSLSCLQAGLWLLSPWKACGGCSWGDMTITKSAHVHSTASSHPRLPVHIRTSEEGVSLSLNCLSWGFLLCFLWLTIIVFVFLSSFSPVFIESEGWAGEPFETLYVYRPLILTYFITINKNNSIMELIISFVSSFCLITNNWWVWNLGKVCNLKR